MADVISQASSLERQARTSPRFRSAVSVSGAMAASGILTYAFQVLAARRLASSSFGEVAVLWGAVFIVAIVFFRPLEQTLSRSIANRLAEGHEVASVLRSVAAVSAGIAAALAVATAAAWGPLTSALFHGDAFMTWMLVTGAAGYGVSYLVRGVLGGVRWFTGYAVVLLADSIGRLVLAAPLFFVTSSHVAAVAVAGAGLCGAAAPLAFARVWLSDLRGGDRQSLFDARGALRFAAPAGVVAGADQLLVNGAPLLVILLGSGGTKEAGIVFAATMLVRAPVYVFTGVAASLLPNFTLLAGPATQELRAVLRRTSAVLLATGVTIGGGVALFGPPAMTILYGGRFDLGRLELVFLGLSVALYLVAATFLQALLALDRGRSVALAWTAAAGALVASYTVLPGDETGRVGLALVVATAVNAVLHVGLMGRVLRRASVAADRPRVSVGAALPTPTPSTPR
jgi:O-antigen/teichoic acid export membrane protein